ncbi:MAG TPA: GlsB/YeaQ/YmgE family stress response membrane protein [Candidatus Limnocylindria bacterium]
MGIIGWIVIGLIAGAIARWIMPGPDPMGWLGTIVLGIVGSLVGGTILGLVTGGGLELSAAGIIGSILGALLVLFLWRRMRPARAAP